MTELRKFGCLILIGIFLSACGGIQQIPTTEIPTLSATPPRYPTNVPTSTPQIPPQTGGFPYAPILSDELPLNGLILGAHVFSDTACYDVGIYNDDSYIVISCLPDFTYPAPSGTLDANESTHLHTWVERFTSYEERSAHGLVMFAGNGTITPDFAEKLSMEYLVFNLEHAAHEYVSGGGWPNGVFAAQQVLSHQLSIPLDHNNVLKFEVVDFPDTCLSVPKIDEVCAQVITPGLRVQLVAQGMLYEYHTDFWGYEIRQVGEPQIAPTQGPAG